MFHLPRLSKGTVVAMKEIDLLQGTLDLLVLKTLSAGRMHGYRIASKIQQLSADVLRVEEGSLYPALYRMEQKGLIESEWGLTDNARRARFYKLTRKGRREMQKETESWLRLSTAVARVLKALEQGA
jgi:PadR family transcriptional regulator